MVQDQPCVEFNNKEELIAPSHRECVPSMMHCPLKLEVVGNWWMVVSAPRQFHEEQRGVGTLPCLRCFVRWVAEVDVFRACVKSFEIFCKWEMSGCKNSAGKDINLSSINCPQFPVVSLEQVQEFYLLSYIRGIVFFWIYDLLRTLRIRLSVVLAILPTFFLWL